MKLALLSAILLLTPTLLRADEVALLEFRSASGELHPVAISFYENDAPATVENFKKLARKKFYDGTTIHRAFPHTLLQMGDPLSRKKERSVIGTGGPGYTLPPEIRHRHGAGDIATARLPDKINPSRASNGSQFFVCLTPMPSYDGQYTVFAHVLYGLEALDGFSAVSVDSNDSPSERITLVSARIVPREALPPAPVPGAPAKKKAQRPWWRPW